MSFCKPILYGTVSRHLPASTRSDGHTHQWTVFVKPYNNEDLSLFVHKVNFRLHDSYKKSVRDVLKPPFEVTETGWGEFEIRIQIHMKDGLGGVSGHVTLYHILKLFNRPADGAKPSSSDLTVVSEHYDEIVFHNPAPALRTVLENPRPLVHGKWKHKTDYEAQKAKTLAAIQNARTKIKEELDNTYAILNAIRSKAGDYRAEISDRGKNPKRV